MLTPWYITGFCDNASSFTFSRSGGTIGLYFVLTQSAQNRQILEEIQQSFNYIGAIYSRKGKSPVVFLRVTKIDELKSIVDHFDKYPLQGDKNREVFQIWRTMVLYKLEHYRRIDYDHLHKLSKQLSLLRKRI